MKKRTPTLSPHDARIIAVAQLAARMPDTKLSRAAHLKLDQFRYYKKNLLDNGSLKPLVLINPHALGYSLARIHVRVSSDRDAWLKHFQSHPQVTWLAELSGTADVALVSRYTNPSEILAPLYDAKKKGESSLTFHELCLQVGLSLFPKKYLGEGSPVDRLSADAAIESIFHADATDKKIINHIAVYGLESARDTARTLGIPHTTFDHRIMRLEKAGVISGYWYMTNRDALGVDGVKVITSFRGLGQKYRKAVFEFCAAQARVVHLVELVGQWDFEFGLEIDRLPQVTQFIAALRQTFGKAVDTVETVSVSKIYKVGSWSAGL